MSLIDSMFETFVFVTKTQVPDGEGGLITSWEDGAEFKAIITLDTTMQTRIAEQEGVTSVYTVTTNKGTWLDFHDVIKRVRDGQTFRITSNSKDKESPTVSSLNIAQCKAEKWEVTQ